MEKMMERMRKNRERFNKRSNLKKISINELKTLELH